MKKTHKQCKLYLSGDCENWDCDDNDGNQVCPCRQYEHDDYYDDFDTEE